MSKKTTRELADLVVSKSNLLGNTRIFISRSVENEIKTLGLTPRSVQLNWLFESVQKFHVTACKFLQKYFSTGLKSTAMDNMSALSPKKQSHVLTSRKLKMLATQYSKVVDNIEFIGRMDKIKSEIDKYVVEDDIKENVNKEQGFEQFRTDVSN